jgi:hypothetical protein
MPRRLSADELSPASRLLLERIDERLGELQLSDREASELAQRHSGAIASLRSGSSPTLRTLQNLATALRCSVSYLIGESDTPGEVGRRPEAEAGDRAVVMARAVIAAVPETEETLRRLAPPRDTLPRVRLKMLAFGVLQHLSKLQGAPILVPESEREILYAVDRALKES